ncbi:disulfide bond formation protein B [bacterium]|nr:disulfide bond formation protein B [bacterium]
MKVVAFFNTLILYGLSAVLLYSYYVQFALSKPPCSLCILQRFFLMGIGVSLCLNITGKMSFKHIGAAILSCVLGSVVSLYQWSMLLENNGISFAPHLFSLPMYVWATFLFFALALLLFLLLFFMKEGKEAPSNKFIKAGFWLFSLVVLSEVLATLFMCGPFLC